MVRADMYQRPLVLDSLRLGVVADWKVTRALEYPLISPMVSAKK